MNRELKNNNLSFGMGLAGKNDEIDLKNLVFTICAYKLFILFVMSCAVIVAWVVTMYMQPRYKTTALLQVNNGASNFSIDSALQSLDAISPGFTQIGDEAKSSEIESALLDSRFILQPTIEANVLNVSATPRYFPIFGAYLARVFAENNYKARLAKPFFGLTHFAWGGEKISVGRFAVDRDFFDNKFYLQVENAGNYNLFSPHNELILRGKVGVLAKSEKGAYKNLQLLITNLHARPGTGFFITRRPDEQILQKLSESLSIIDLGDRRNTGILSLTLVGADKDKLPQVLNTIIGFAVQNNVQQKSGAAQKTLGFLNQQLPILKDELNMAEIALDNYRVKTGSLGIGTEGDILLKQIVDVEQNVEKLHLKKAELLQEFTSRHPLIIAINSQQNRLQKELLLLKQQIKRLPLTEQKAISLEREVKVKNQLYILLLSKIQQVQMLKAGIVGDVHILDVASVPPMELPTSKLLILLASMVFGFILALMITFLRRAFSHGVEDFDYAEERLGIPSYAIIPYSKKQTQIFNEMKRKLPSKGPYILAKSYSRDVAIEGMRSLRTTIQFLLLEAKNNIISIMGSGPGIGKSFLSLNLAYICAEAGKKVVLIDADLRKGKINKYLSQPQSPGLTEIINAEVDFVTAKRVVMPEKLDFIACGSYPNNPSEIIMRKSFTDFLSALSLQYDVVLIDTPPILAVTEGVLISKHTAVNLMVVGAHKETLREVEHAVKRAQKNGIIINGLVFNSTLPAQRRYNNYNYYYYKYE